MNRPANDGSGLVAVVIAVAEPAAGGDGQVAQVGGIPGKPAARAGLDALT